MKMTHQEVRDLNLRIEDERRIKFRQAQDFETALKVAWGGQADVFKNPHAYYCHYTTLPHLLSTILSGNWYLIRSTSSHLNDQQELMKFGDEKIARHTYQLSFSNGVQESVAFWGLYGQNNPLAIKVLLPASAIKDWLEDLKKNNFDAEFKDIVYASIPLARWVHREKTRGYDLYWNGATCTLGGNVSVKRMLPSLLKDARCTGWFKDIEWRHENETRLCVRCPNKKTQSIYVPFPPELVEKMSFTFSPWADEGMMDQLKEILVFALKENQKKIVPNGKFREMGNRFHASTLFGALNFPWTGLKSCCYERSRLSCLKELNSHPAPLWLMSK